MYLLTQEHPVRLPLKGWDASWFYFPSDVEKLTCCPLQVTMILWSYSSLSIHYAMIRGFHRVITTTYISTFCNNLPSPFLNRFHVIVPKIWWCRQERYYYLYLWNLRLREFKMTPRISHGFVEIKKLKPTFSKSNLLGLTLILACDIHCKLASWGNSAMCTSAQEHIAFCQVDWQYLPKSIHYRARLLRLKFLLQHTI